jgi:hypothetical protein
MSSGLAIVGIPPVMLAGLQYLPDRPLVDNSVIFVQ